MRLRTLPTVALTAALALGAARPALAGPFRKAAERAEDRHELRQDARQTTDDWRDLAVIEGLLNRFDDARARGDMGTLAAIDQQLKGYVTSELREDRRELRQDKAEVRRDVREARADRLEGDDVRTVRDDQRDTRKDVRDVKVEQAIIERRRAIAVELRALDTRLDPASLDAKRTLVAELVGLAKGELRKDVQERREDRRELREDRRN